METKGEQSGNCGIKRWDLLKQQLRNLSPTEALQLMQEQPEMVIIDCRKPEEVNQVRIPNAVHIDYLAYDFWERISQLPTDGHYLVYCNSCRRSTRACTLMQNGGFTYVYNLDGGLNDWLEELGTEGLDL
jgi:rhodanese-related sulfurtransferase